MRLTTLVSVSDTLPLGDTMRLISSSVQHVGPSGLVTVSPGFKKESPVWVPALSKNVASRAVATAGELEGCAADDLQSWSSKHRSLHECPAGETHASPNRVRIARN